MSAGIYDITIDQGADFAVQFAMKNHDDPVDLTGYSARGEIRARKLNTSDVIAEFDCTILDALNGLVKFELHNSVTKDITPGTYYYDIELYLPSDVAVTRILQGIAKITAEVTR